MSIKNQQKLISAGGEIKDAAATAVSTVVVSIWR